MIGTTTCESYEDELDRLTARLADNMRGTPSATDERGQIGPCPSVEELWNLVPSLLGVNAPPTIVETHLRRIGFHAEKVGSGWWLDLSKSRQLIAAAWGDDPET